MTPRPAPLPLGDAAAWPAVGPRRRSLRAGAAWAFAGNAGYALCQWATLALMTKLTAPAQVGHFALALALVAPVLMLFNLQLRALQATDFRADYGFGDYLGLRLLSAVAGLATLLGLALAGGYRGGVLGIILAVGVMRTLDAVGGVFHGALQRRERLDLISVSQLLRGVLALALTGVLLRAGGGVGGVTVAMAGASAALLLLFDLPVTRRTLAAEAGGGRPALRPRFRWRLLGRLTLLALPLGVVLLLVSLVGNVPRYFVERQLGAAELGLFSAMAYALVAGMTVVSAVGEAAMPKLARAYAAGRREEFARLVRRLVQLGAALGAAGLVAAALAGRQLLTLAYTPAYAGRQGTFVLLMAAAAVSYVGSFLGYAVTAARVLRVQAPLCAGVLAVTAGACALWVPRYGLAGAALATLVGAAVQLAGYGVLTLRACAALRRPAAGEGAP